MTDQPKKILLFCKKDFPDPSTAATEMIPVTVFGAVVIPDDEVPSQGFIDLAWIHDIQIATYDYYPEEENKEQWEPVIFERGKAIADRLNNLLMAEFN